MREQKLLFESWQEYKSADICWKDFQQQAGPIRNNFNSYLLRGSASGDRQLTGVCNELLPRKQHLWTFPNVEGVEPTNNTAECALRPAVIYCKLSFGTQSDSGSRYLERILTVSETCRLQNRNAYEYLIQFMISLFNGTKPPSLLPQ